MTSFYWYASPYKLRQFVKAPGASVTAGFKVVLPWLEANVSREGDGAGDVLADLAAFRKKEKRLNIPGTIEAQAGLFRFEGEAARTITDGLYAFAVADGEVALLLAGSAEHALGGRPPRESDNAISPSSAPLEALTAAFAESVGRPSETDGHVSWGATLPQVLTYMWQATMRTADRDVVRLPRASGVAMFALEVTPDRRELRRAGMADKITRLIVGSPVYIGQ